MRAAISDAGALIVIVNEPAAEGVLSGAHALAFAAPASRAVASPALPPLPAPSDLTAKRLRQRRHGGQQSLDGVVCQKWIADSCHAR